MNVGVGPPTQNDYLARGLEIIQNLFLVANLLLHDRQTEWWLHIVNNPSYSTSKSLLSPNASPKTAYLRYGSYQMEEEVEQNWKHYKSISRTTGINILSFL